SPGKYNATRTSFDLILLLGGSTELVSSNRALMLRKRADLPDQSA
ncbi:hypothetical protein THAOC_22050, partial [Thalassiosira oceanica]